MNTNPEEPEDDDDELDEQQNEGEVAELRKEVAALREERRVDAIVAEHGLAAEHAREVVRLVDGAAGKLTNDDAVAILRQRAASGTAQLPEAQIGSQSQYGSLRPTPSSEPRPKVSDYQQRMAFVKQTRTVDKRFANRVADNVLGGLMAKAMGWQHHKIPLPGRGR